MTSTKLNNLLTISVTIVLYTTTPVISHTMGLGSCPRVQPMKDFDLEKLMGEWFVIQKFATSSSCMKYNFTKDSDDVLRVVQTRQHFILDKMVDHTYTYIGVLTVPDPSIPSKMRVKFPLNIAGEADFMIFMTDYSVYAGVFTCQKILFGHTQSASILSRKSTLDADNVVRLRKSLTEQGVDVDDFSVVSQAKCISKEDSNLNIRIDDKMFSTKSKKTGGKNTGSGEADGGSRDVEVNIKTSKTEGNTDDPKN